MSYVGKLLVVVQVVLSIMFMAFAGAVYTTHANWNGKLTAAQASVTKLQSDLRDAQNDLTVARDQAKAEVDKANQEMNRVAAENITLTTTIASRELDIANLTRERDAAVGLGQTKAAEAAYRQEEAEKLRVANAQLQQTVDALTVDTRQKSDQIFEQEAQLAELNRRYERALAQATQFRDMLVKSNVSLDPETTKDKPLPPPPVDGIVQNVQRNNANRVSLVSITVGSDDGLKKGDVLSVYRAKDSTTVEFLGTVRVVDIGPDSAVCEAVLLAKNGIIEKGDNVTTRIRGLNS